MLSKFFMLEAKWYAITYLLLIPLFGTIYFFNNNDFYQSNNLYEAESEQEILNIIKVNIKKVLIDHVNYYAITNYKKKCNTYEALRKYGTKEEDLRIIQKVINNMIMNGSSVLIGERTFKKDLDKKIRLDFLFYFMNSKDDDEYINKVLNKEQQKQLFLFRALVQSAVHGHIEYTKGIPNTMVIIDKYAGENACDLAIKDLFSNHVVSEINSEHVIKLQKVLVNYDNFLDGEPTKYGDQLSNFIKMFYFSTVTITTLGYGDIVPTSNFTRILVSIESILGIILIGLFLNAIAHKR